MSLRVWTGPDRLNQEGNEAFAFHLGHRQNQNHKSVLKVLGQVGVGGAGETWGSLQGPPCSWLQLMMSSERDNHIQSVKVSRCSDTKLLLRPCEADRHVLVFHNVSAESAILTQRFPSEGFSKVRPVVHGIFS